MTDTVRTIGAGAYADAIFSADGATLFTAQGGTITAFSVATGAQINSWTIGAQIGGMDVSADGQTLVAAERTTGPTVTNSGLATHEIKVYSINLGTSVVTTYSTSTNSYYSPYDVLALDNGKALITLDDLGSNATPLSSLDLASGVFTIQYNLGNNYSARSIFNPAADHATTLFRGFSPVHGYVHMADNAGNITNGSYNPFMPGSSYYIGAISAAGNLIVSGVGLYDLQLNTIPTPAILNQQFDSGFAVAGLALTSDGTRLYVLDSVHDQILEFDTSDWHIARAFSAGDTITTIVSSIPEDGLAYGDRLEISADGHTLSVIGDHNLQLVNLNTVQSTVGTEGDDVITGTPGDDVILGFGGNDRLDGGAGSDTMTGGAGNDTLDGGPGSDTMTGGAGNDIYYVDSTGDQAIEAENGGTDTVITSVSMFISYQVEILRAAAGAAVTLSGGFGHADILIGAELDDALYGYGGGDTLTGGLGNDLLDGGFGGGGIAVINAARAAASIALGAGGNVIVTSPDGIDTLHNIQTVQFNDATFTVSDLYTKGTEQADTLTGGAGPDAIFGYGGNDTLNGSDGDDLLAGGDGDDVLDGGAGTDTARIAGSMRLASVTIAENGDAVITTAEGQDRLHSIEWINADDFEGPTSGFVRIGTSGVDDITAASNWAFGLAGNDILRSVDSPYQHLVGGSGDDTYYLNKLAYDVVYEDADGGFDTVILNFAPDSSHGYYIPTNVEKMVLGVATGARLNGDAGNNVLVGNDGSDILSGNAGDDVLTGGASGDVLAGGAGLDIFRDTAAGFNGDGIVDLAIGEVIHFTDATLAGFSFSLGAAIPRFPGASSYYQMLTYTGGSLGLSDLPANTALQASADGAGGVDLTLVATQPAHAVRNDFNGDGKSDILWRSAGQVGDWLATGGGNFAANPTLYGASGDWKIAGTGDFNGDGKSDLLWRNDDGRLGDWFGAAGGTFSANATLSGAPTDWQVVGTGDFNGDGRSDILWRNIGGNVGTWSADANGNFSANATLYGVDNSWKIAGTGDFNGDGRADILWRNTTTGQLGDWLANADGTFTPNATLSSAPLNWHIAETGDFNGDGRADILWRSDTGQVGDWLADANGNFAPNATLSSAPLEWKIVETGDYNGDGRTDILWRNMTTGQTGDWLADANGNFTPNATLYGAPLDWNVASDHAFLV